MATIAGAPEETGACGAVAAFLKRRWNAATARFARPAGGADLAINASGKAKPIAAMGDHAKRAGSVGTAAVVCLRVQSNAGPDIARPEDGVDQAINA